MGSAGSQSSAHCPRASIAARFIYIVIRGYQCCISPLLGSRCRFYPSCSHYALEAVQQYGAVHGCWLTVKRLLRCHPLHDGGFDPVPPNNREKPATSSCNHPH